jgi:hypothetical protein
VRRIYAPALLCLALACPAWGQDPPKAALVVTPAGPVAPGTLVILDATATVGDSLDWDTDVPDESYREDTGHRLVYFVAPRSPGKYPFKLMALSIVDGKIATSKAKVAVEVAGPAPAPTPTPDPPPDVRPKPPPLPAPIPPDDPFGLAAIVRGRLAASGWSGPDMKAGATILADTLAGQAAAASIYPSAQAMLDATGRLARSNLGPAAYQSWRDAIVYPVRDRVAALNAQGQLTTPAELAKAFVGIAKALREVQ